ncbi:DUF1634 domain-containing protein [Paenibacillus sp. GCM10027626]|uniref:DUF1634 domain-containing protein n=1 Tax=Paenibacillus sp. GCM10027626 TaxID=3273411 RepID=UPI003629B9BC
MSGSKAAEQSNNDSIAAAELIVGRSLQVGVFASAAVILTGLILFLVSADSGYAEHMFPTSLPEIGRGLLDVKPYAIILTGLFMLILTPVLRVAISVLVFLRAKDYLYVGITLFVLAVLIIGFL